MATMLTALATVVATKEQVSCDLAGEAVILHLKDGTYYGLNQVGSRVWHLIQEPTTINGVLDAIQREYEVDADRCRRDVLALLEELATRGLIEVKG